MRALATSCWKQSKPEDSGATYLSTKRKKKLSIQNSIRSEDILQKQKQNEEFFGHAKAERICHQQTHYRSLKRSHGYIKRIALDSRSGIIPNLHKGIKSIINDIYVKKYKTYFLVLKVFFNF